MTPPCHMTPEEFIAFATARHGKRWKMPLAKETGWSYWTFRRIETGEAEVSEKLADKINSLRPRK